ncbi:MAG TPA: Gfo/Idh/MocA family oxidoreductase [Planctomycetota bacterium]|jgi:predicted dehydrogenase|nr:Gfo/Idh/MocA family oxidoreductase [Planctomycetota bacterium]
MSSTRREFLAAGATLAAAPFVRAVPQDRTFRTALIGSGWWGKNILREAMDAKRSKIAALCDVDRDVLEAAADLVKDHAGDRPKTYGDYREMLDREKPEIVIIATPDHWHGLTAIAALKAGAHVFVEKPTGHTVGESRSMLKTARETGRVVQVGLHRRIGPHHVSAQKFLKDGNVGTVGMVRLFAHSGGGAERPSPNAAAPEGLNWEFYCGPSPLRPFNRRIHPGGWRQFLDFGNGQLGDWGVHWLDQVLAWTDEPWPRRIYSTGGRSVKGKPVLNEQEQTTDAPDHQIAVYEFEGFTCTWEHRQFAGNEAEKHSIGAYFYGSKGTLHIGWRDGWTFHPSNPRDKTIHEDSQLQEPDGHNLKLLWADFIDSIDKNRAPVAGIERAHRSSCLPLLGMLSMKIGRSVRWDGAKEDIVDDPEASRLLRRTYRAPWEYPA